MAIAVGVLTYLRDVFLAIVQNPIWITVLSGTLVFTAGQIIQNFILKPLQEFNAIRGRIDSRLLFYANVIHSYNDAEKLREEAGLLLRDLAGELQATYNQILGKGIYAISDSYPTH